MGYYFGCSTGANRCAWFWYILIVAAGIASLSFWGYQNTGCINDSMTCAENAGLANDLTVNNAHFVQMNSPEQFCSDLFGGRNSTAVMSACLTCANQWVDCWQPTVPLLYAGVILMIASLFPCFYCCCCSSAPSSEKYY